MLYALLLQISAHPVHFFLYSIIYKTTFLISLEFNELQWKFVELKNRREKAEENKVLEENFPSTSRGIHKKVVRKIFGNKFFNKNFKDFSRASSPTGMVPRRLRFNRFGLEL